MGSILCPASNSFTTNVKFVSQWPVCVDQTLHLILIFCVTVNGQQCPILSPATFLCQLENGKVTKQLCHAICAASVPYSRHSSCTESGLQAAFAYDAREGLESLDVDTHARYQQLLTLSVLSLYETSMGNGIQAWYDLGRVYLPHIDVKAALVLTCSSDCD